MLCIVLNTADGERRGKQQHVCKLVFMKHQSMPASLLLCIRTVHLLLQVIKDETCNQCIRESVAHHPPWLP